MKAVIICRDYPPAVSGLGDYTYHTAREMAARGVDVTVLTSAGPVEDAKDEGFRIRAVISRWDSAGVSDIIEELRRAEPDVVFFQYVPHMYGRSGICPWVIALYRRIKASGVPLVAIFHELYYPLTVSKRLPVGLVHRFQAAALMSIADVSVVTTPARLNTMRRWLPLLANRMTEIPVGSNIPVADASPDLLRALRERLNAKGPLIGGFGTLQADERNHGLLFDAIARLRQVHQGCRFVWIGSVDRDSRGFRVILDGAKRHGVEDAVIWTGAMDRVQVSHHLSALDVFISLQDDGPCFRRGSLVVAMAHGLPIIALDGKSRDPRLVHGESMLIASRSAEAIAKAADGLLGAPADRERLGAAAKALHDEYLDWGTIAEQLIRVCGK